MDEKVPKLGRISVITVFEVFLDESIDFAKVEYNANEGTWKLSRPDGHILVYDSMVPQFVRIEAYKYGEKIEWGDYDFDRREMMLQNTQTKQWRRIAF